MRLVYPLLWSRLDRKADRGQSVATAAALSRCGVEVTLLMPQDRGDPALTPVDLKAWFQVEGDFQVAQRPSHWAGAGLLRTLMWLRQVFRDPELRQTELLYSRIPAMLGAGAKSPIPFAVEHYRPWPDELPVIRPLLRRTARSPNFLGMILHSHYAAGAYRRAGVEEDRLLVAHNGADPPSAACPGRNEARRTLGLPQERPIALYAGRLSAQKGLDQLLALADLRPDVLFLLVGSEGDGPIETEARRRSNVQALPWQMPDALSTWLSTADVLLIPASRAPLERHRNCVLPIKLFSYLAAGRPIVAPKAADTAELLTHEHNAILVPPDDPEAAAAGLDRLLGDPVLAARLAETARLLASELTWDARAKRIAGFLAERLKQSV